MVVAAVQVAAHFTGVIDLEVVAFFSESSVRVPFQSPSIHGESLSKAGAAWVQVARLNAVNPPIRFRAFRLATGSKTALSRGV